MVLMTFCLLAAFSLDSAAKCDDYVVGTVWVHKGDGNDEVEKYEGCKKGCFWNNSYTEMGVRKCEKCSDITDEITCTNNDATCRWKGGKCKPQSCPQIANTRNTGAFVLNNTKAAASKGRERLLKECVEGSELEKKYNNQYWNDYVANRNLEEKAENYRDTCTVPTCGSEGFTSNEAANRDKCVSYSGCTFAAATPIVEGGTVNHEFDRCYTNISGTNCSNQISASADSSVNRIACNSKTGCSFVERETTGGYDRCVVGCTLFVRGQDTKSQCEALPGGCIYIGLDTGDGKYLSYSDRCEVGCHDKFVPGTDTKAHCDALHCGYRGDDWKENVAQYVSVGGLCYDSFGNVESGYADSESCLAGNTYWTDFGSYCSNNYGDSVSCNDETSCYSSCYSQWADDGYCTNNFGDTLSCNEWSCSSTCSSYWTYDGYCTNNVGDTLSCGESSCSSTCSSYWNVDGYCSDDNCEDEASCSSVCSGYWTDTSFCSNGYGDTLSCNDQASCSSCSGYWIDTSHCSNSVGDSLSCNDQASCSSCSGYWIDTSHCSNYVGDSLSCSDQSDCYSSSCSPRWITNGECRDNNENFVGDSKSSCEQNNRQWVGGSVYPGDGTNLKSGGIFTNCTFWETEQEEKCGINSTLDIRHYSDRCDDRLYEAPSQECRTLFHIKRQKCEYDINELNSYRVFETSKLGGNLRPGTRYEKCVQDERLRADEYKTVEVPLIVGGEADDERHANLTETDREILFGFRTPEAYCQHIIDLDLADCLAQEEDDIQTCYSAGEDLALDYTLLFRDHVGTKAASAACREIYGCMYAKDNERCSAWAVWALVLTIVLVVVVVVAALAVVGVFVLLKVLKSKA